MKIEQLIQVLKELGEKYSFEHYVQFSGCYGSTTDIFYIEDVSEIELYVAGNKEKGINIPTDFCSG